MRDLDLGPKSKSVLERWAAVAAPNVHDPAEAYMLGLEMADLLHRWVDDSWCWIDASPARICGGPHFKVTYVTDDRTDEVIEQADHVGEMFPGVPYTVARSR